MKISKLFATLLGCVFLITGCSNTPKNNGSTDLDDDIVSIDDIVVEEDNDDEEQITTKTCEEISYGQSGGSLIDLMAGSYIEPSATYTCSFSHERTFNGEYTIRSDDRTIAQVTHEANTNSFVIKGITPGDAIIQAVTDDGEIVLQFVVHCRKRIPLNKIGNALYNVDKFNGMFSGYKLSFVSEDPLKGTLVGSDDFENTFVNFKLVDGVEERIGNGTDFNTYKFKISVDTETSVTSRVYTDLYVATTGEKIYMYYANGIVDIFTSYYIDIHGSTERN